MGQRLLHPDVSAGVPPCDSDHVLDPHPNATFLQRRLGGFTFSARSMIAQGIPCDLKVKAAPPPTHTRHRPPSTWYH